MVFHQKLAKDVMNPKPCVIRDHANLGDVATILAHQNLRAVVLCSTEGRLTGIFTETDLAKSFVEKKDLSTPMAHLMTVSPAFVRPEDPLDRCVEIMEKHNCRHIPVIERDRIVGLISILPVQQAISKDLRRHVDELEEAQRRLSRRDEYLAVVAHDVRSPLSIIKMCCDMMLIYKKDNLTADQIDLLTRIEQNSIAANKLLSDLLDIGRLNTGIKLKFVQQDIHVFLGKIIANENYAARQKNISIELVSSSPVHAMIDPDRYGEIITNLINNAVKFSKKNSKIEISATLKGPPSTLAVSIKDYGIGIPKDKLPKLFEKYEQAHEYTSKMGFGLGLSIAIQFTHLHGGTIEVSSEEGKGSTFTVLTPASPSQSPDAQTRSNERVSQPK